MPERPDLDLAAVEADLEEGHRVALPIIRAAAEVVHLPANPIHGPPVAVDAGAFMRLALALAELHDAWLDALREQEGGP